MSLARAPGSSCTRGMAKSESRDSGIDARVASNAAPSSTSSTSCAEDPTALLVHGIRPGVRLAVDSDAPFGGPRIVRIGGCRVAIDRRLAQSVRVAPRRRGRRPVQPSRTADERLAGPRRASADRRDRVGERAAPTETRSAPAAGFRSSRSSVGPNVGKSTFIARLTGRYEEAANVPGTTVGDRPPTGPARRSRRRPRRPAGRPLAHRSERRSAAVLADAPGCPARRDPVDRRRRRARPAPAARPGLPRPRVCRSWWRRTSPTRPTRMASSSISGRLSQLLAAPVHRTVGPTRDRASAQRWRTRSGWPRTAATPPTAAPP